MLRHETNVQAKLTVSWWNAEYDVGQMYFVLVHVCRKETGP